MRITLSVTQQEFKEARQAYTSHYWSKARRIASTLAMRVGFLVVVLLAMLELFRHPPLLASTYFPLLAILVIIMVPLYGASRIRILAVQNGYFYWTVAVCASRTCLAVPFAKTTGKHSPR
jgi:hypothetical protein